MHIILWNVWWKTCLDYRDDVPAFSKNHRQHVPDINEGLALFRQAVGILKLPKCYFIQKNIEYVGRILLSDRLAAAYNNVYVIRTAVFQTDSKQMRWFWSACNVFKRFIKYITKTAQPLNDYLGKDMELDWLDPTTEALQTFCTWKSVMVHPPVFALLQPPKLYMVGINLFANALGAVLLQQQKDSNLDEWATIGFWNQTLK